MNYLVINNVVRLLESKQMVNLKSWAIVIFVLTSLILLSNFITLHRKRNLQKPGIFHHLTQMLHCLASKHAAVT